MCNNRAVYSLNCSSLWPSFPLVVTGFSLSEHWLLYSTPGWQSQTCLEEFLRAKRSERASSPFTLQVKLCKQSGPCDYDKQWLCPVTVLAWVDLLKQSFQNISLDPQMSGILSLKNKIKKELKRTCLLLNPTGYPMSEWTFKWIPTLKS